MGADLCPPLFLWLSYSMSIGRCLFPSYDGMLSRFEPGDDSASLPVV